MPSLELFLLFLAADLVLKFSPGPDVAVVLTRGMTQGARAGIACALGVGATAVVQVPAAVLGLGAVFQASPTLYAGVKMLGAVYLLWVGAKALRRFWRGEVGLPDASVEHAAFRQGFVSNLPNPKVYIFLIAFVPQFVDPATGPVWSQTLVLVAVMKTNGVVFLAALALTASRVRGWVAAHPWFLRWQDGLLGGVMVALAGWVAFGPDGRAPAR